MAALTDYSGVVTGVLINNTARQANRAAIQAAVDDCAANSKILVVPPATYEIHNAAVILPAGFRLLGTMESRIVQYSLDKPVVHVGAVLGTTGVTVEHVVIDGLYLRYSGTATAGGNALELQSTYMCDFRNIQIGDVQSTYASRTSVPYIGVFCDDATGTTPCFSCSYTNIRIKHFGYRGFSANRLNYEAATGNVWNNIYIAGGNSAGKQDLSAVAGADMSHGALILGSQAQGVFNQLNIEWLTGTGIIKMEVCDQMVFNSVNLEGLSLKASSSRDIGFIDVYNGSFTIEGLTINNCIATAALNASTASILRLGPATVARVNNVRPLLNTGITTSFYGVRSNSAASSRVDFGQFALGNGDAMTAYDDGTFAAGTGNGYGQLTDFNGGGMHTLADANATIYSYRGDSVVRVPATAVRTIILSRQCSSTITTRIPPGTRKRIKATSSNSVAVQNYNAAALATITTGTFAEFVFDGTDWLLA
jgi:hypothetical protein